METGLSKDLTTAVSPDAGSASDRYGIVVFSHLRWSFVWQRPQQFLSRFGQRHPVLFVEEPDFRLAEGDEPILVLEDVGQNVTVAQVHLPFGMRRTSRAEETMRRFTREAIDSVNGSGAFDCPLLWYYSPMEAAWSLGHIEGRGVVYDCMDELSQFRNAPAELVHWEQRLLKQADIVFTGGYELYLKKSKQHPNVHFFGCGVEYAHFSRAQDPATPIPADVADLPTPVIGWFGVVDERVDYDLLAEVAAARPDWSLVLVGPVVKVDPNTLPQAPNLHWLGGRDYNDLPSYCKAFDVCMMCFALNEATEYINPTKALEYLATGKPVVSTAVADVVRQYSDTVSIATSTKDFIEKTEEILRRRPTERIEQGIALAQECGWERTVARMQELIEAAIVSPREAAYLS